MADQRVLVIGGGVAGLAAAAELADLDVGVTIVERSDFPGGHAIQYTCKATDRCVKCGACMVEEKLGRVVQNPKIRLLKGARVQAVLNDRGFSVTLMKKPVLIDPGKCTDCGVCFERCPEDKAVLKGFSRSHSPFYAISREMCRYFKDRSCTACRDACPERAIDLDAPEATVTADADAVILATGFTPFRPEDKPYGYGMFKNVVTNLEMERLLRRRGRAIRPSDGAVARSVAFVQCVGSRDAKRNHLWCSEVCCGSALRMAALLQARQSGTEITFFYMDVQTFGRDFETFYAKIRQDVRMIRTLPGDIYPADGERLRVTFWDNASSRSLQEEFDLVVLSIGIIPCRGTKTAADALHLPIADTGFVAGADSTGVSGVFAAGTATGPMTIPEAIASAGRAVGEVVKYLGI